MSEYIDQLLAEMCTFQINLFFKQTLWEIGRFLKGWQMDVPQGLNVSAEPKAFVEGVHPHI